MKDFLDSPEVKLHKLSAEHQILHNFIADKAHALDGLSAILHGLSFLDEDLAHSEMLISAISFVGNSLFEITKELKDLS